MRNSLRTLFFAVALAFVCSLALVGANQLARPYREANELAEQRGNLLSALSVAIPEHSSAKELNTLFEQVVKTDRKQNGYALYDYVPESGGNGTPEATAILFSGPGLWGYIYGVIALEPDLKTIRGIRFYKQEETPGLGGDIGSKWFQDRFVGKSLVSADGKPGFRVMKPGVAAPAENAVDAITGATMTSDLVQKMLDNLAKKLITEEPHE